MTQAHKKEEKYTIIDGKDMVLGRLGSVIAKRLLMGEKIKLVNCKDIIMLGRKKFLVERYNNKIANKVTKKGPYYSRNPADIVKRSIRNMLPYKSQRGIIAYKNLLCYTSVPSTLINKEKEVHTDSKVDYESTFYYTNIGELCTILSGGNK